MILYPHQLELIEKNPDRHLLAHGTGSGKSLMSLQLAGKRMEATLIICPKMLKEKWERDADHVPFQTLVLTKEEFKRQAHTLPNYKTVIVDEAHFFFGPTSQMHKSLKSYFARYKTPNRYLLTATPYMSTPWNIYAAAVLLGQAIDYQKFRAFFFAEIRMGHRFIWKAKEGKKYTDALHSIVMKIGSSVQLSDVFDVPEQKHETVLLQMTPEQEQAIEECYDPVAIVQWTNIHKLENLGGAKSIWLREFAKTHTKFVVFVRYLDQLHEYQDMLSHTNNVLVIYGAIKDRDMVVARANEAENCILIIQADCSEGYELPTFDTVVFASLSFSYKNLVQARGRVLRANALHKNTFYYLLIDGGVDAEVYKTLGRRQDFSFALLDS